MLYALTKLWFFMPSTKLKLIVVINALVALLTAGGTLVLLLIAPLGLAAVLTCTLLVGLLTFGAGLAADLVIWGQRLGGGNGSGDGVAGLGRGAGLRLPQSESSRLPTRRPS